MQSKQEGSVCGSLGQVQNVKLFNHHYTIIYPGPHWPWHVARSRCQPPQCDNNRRISILLFEDSDLWLWLSFSFFLFFFRLYYILYDININMYIYIPFLYTTAVALSSSRHFCMGEKSWDLSGPRTHAGPRIDGNKRSVENNAPLQGKVFIFWPFAFLISSMLHFVFHILFTYDPIFSIKLIIVTDTVKFLFESTSWVYFNLFILIQKSHTMSFLFVKTYRDWKRLNYSKLPLRYCNYWLFSSFCNYFFLDLYLFNFLFFLK